MTDEPERQLGNTRLNRRRKALFAATALATSAIAIAVATVLFWRQRSPERHFANALRALDTRRFDEVRSDIEALEGIAAYEPHQHFLRGSLLLENGQYYRALEEFGGSVNDPELRVGSLTLSGQAAYKAGHLQDAVGLLEQAVEADPNAVDAMQWLASAYYDLGIGNRAIFYLNRLAELVPENPRPHRLMGLIRKDFENYSAAIADYRESLRRDGQQPDRDDILLELAACEFKLDKAEAALATLADCRPCADRWMREAECHYRLGRKDEARRLLDQALRAEPAHLSGLLLAGTIAFEEHNAAAALQVWWRASIAYPRDYLVRFKLSQAYRRAGDNREADKQAKLAEEIKGIRLEFSKLHEKAEAEPQNADVRCRLGKLARELDRPDLARVWFRAALAINPRHEETLRLLAGQVLDSATPSDATRARAP